MARFENPYRLFEATPDGNVVSPSGLILTGAARMPHQEGTERRVEGRSVWRWHRTPGQPTWLHRVITTDPYTWLLFEQLYGLDGEEENRWGLLWIEDWNHELVLNVRSIRHRLRSELMTLQTFAEEGIDVMDAATQIELALRVLPENQTPSWGPPSRSQLH